jgi:ribosomal protein S6
MAEDTVVMEGETADDAGVLRVYEAGYHISPSVKEEDIESTVAGIRAVVEKAGGSFIAEGAPVLTKLAFPIFGMDEGKSHEFDRGFFGWLKFESSLEAADELRETLTKHPSVFRSMVFRTVREETRAKMKAPQLREVKRTDTLKAMPRKVEESAPVSEVDLEKALQDITND